MSSAAVPPSTSEPGPWARRFAFATALFAVPLVLFGGTVTTLQAGMAVEGWLIAEGHFLPFFPVEKWFRDPATFVEHTHRLFGTLVGLTAVACAALSARRGVPAGARAGAWLALVAVCAQGTLGGLRVLENEPRLAFLHGALAQFVFVLLCANAALFSRGWRSATVAARVARDGRRALSAAAWVALAATGAQVVLGAWYRHGLRPVVVEDAPLRLALHGAGALLVLASAAAVARRGAALREAEGELPAGLARALRAVPVLLLVQLVLGGLAWAGFRPGAVGLAEWALSVAHVLGGALLFGSLGVVALWARRLAAEAAPGTESGLAARSEAR